MKSIYSQKVLFENKLQPATIQIHDGKIHSVLKGKKSKNAYDFGEKIIMPGVVDVHVHINEPGRTDWEGFETATKAAARGGTTTLVDMPLNSSPVVTNLAAFEKKLEAAQGKLSVNCGFWAGAINADSKPIIELTERGCLGVKVFLSQSGIDEFPNISLPDLDKLMADLKAYDVPILAHCELDTLPAETNLKNNPTSYPEYLKSRPKSWENEAVKAFIELGKRHRARIHIVHLSSADCLPMIEKAKKENPKLTVETCPHYLIFDAKQVSDTSKVSDTLNHLTLYKCAPPIREKANNHQLKQALKSGLIDFITTDHSPAPPEIKELGSGNLAKAWGGIAGLQFLLSASWTALDGILDLEEFIPLLTSKPAHFLGLDNQIGQIKEGFKADLTIWNPNESFVVKRDMIEHRHKATPYEGMTLKGKIFGTFVNGEPMFLNDKFSNLKAGKSILKQSQL